MTHDVYVVTSTLLTDFENWQIVNRDLGYSTTRHNKYNLEKFFRSTDHFDEATFKSFLAQNKRLVKSGTFESYIRTARVFCDYLIAQKLTTSNWARSIKLPKVEKPLPVILTIGEIKQILNCDLPTSYRNFKNSEEARATYDLIFWLLALTGARIGEVLKIKISDINLIDCFWNASKTKTRKARLVPFPEFLVSKIKILSAGKGSDEYLFTNPRSGLQMNLTTVGLNLRRRIKKCGITKRATVHTFRHSFIVEMFRQDVSPLKIANIVGHDNIKTTQDYARLLFEDLKAAQFKHPLIANERTPGEILLDLKKVIEKFGLQEDDRFMVETKESRGTLDLKVRMI